MEREFVFTGDCFILPEHFIEFGESIGYTKTDMSFNIGNESADIWWDPRMVEYVKSHFDWRGRFMKGATSYKYRIGFAGAVHILKVDTSKYWRLARKRVNGIEEFVVEYVDVHKNDKGRVWLAASPDIEGIKKGWQLLVEDAKKSGNVDMEKRCTEVLNSIETLINNENETIIKIE